MGMFDIFKKKELDKQSCADSNSSGKGDKIQTDDAYVSLSDFCASEKNSKLYTYMDITVLITTDNKLSAFIVSDTGYEPMVLYRDHLIDELGFTLEKEYGLTDMTQEYSYKGNSFHLEYDADSDTIFFQVDIKNEKIPKYFFETVSYLENIDVTKCKY